MMGNKTKLINDTILYAIANFGSAALNFLLLPLYTRYFSPTEFGTWDIALTTIALLTPIVTLELVSATYRWLIVATDLKEQGMIVTTGIIQILKQLFIVNLLAAGAFFIWPFPYSWQALALLNLSVITSFLLQCTRALKRNLLFASMSLFQTTLIISVNLILLLVYKFRIEAFFYAHISASIVICIILFFALPLPTYIFTGEAKKLFMRNNETSRKLLNQYFTYSLPIIPAAVSWWIMTMSDRWIIALFLGINANGIYAIAIKIPSVLLMLNTVFSLAWKDSAIATFKAKEKDAYYSLVFQHYFRLLSIAVIALTLLAKPIIIKFIGEAYTEAWKYSGILLIGALFHSLSLFWSAGFHGAKQTNAILRSSIVGALVNVIINLLFIRYLGLYAVALSTSIAFFTTWIMRVKEAKGYFHIKINKIELSIFVILIIAACLVP